MTDSETESAAPQTAEENAALTGEQATALSGKGKAFWAGVGIGSAAIVAAAMYARRPKKKK